MRSTSQRPAADTGWHSINDVAPQRPQQRSDPEQQLFDCQDLWDKAEVRFTARCVLM